jgi:hypothetical protein
MTMETQWDELIFSDQVSFEEKVRQVFEYQYKYNAVYHRYCKAQNPQILGKVQDDSGTIPLLPVKAFKDADVITESDTEPELIFKSSGTSSMQRSVHQVADASAYDHSILQGFDQFYTLEKSVIWGYTPGYADNPESSLIYMIQKLIDQDKSGLSRFLPLDEPLQKSAVNEVERQNKQLILFGAAFGLLDLLESKQVNLPSNSIVIETGGMKTHRREITKRELHRRLARGFGLDNSRVHSEYGMAELLSQAYAMGGEWFRTVPWMQVSIRNPENPFEEQPAYEEGLIGIIDLANVHSCSFLLTGDKGVMDNNGRFKVLGRWNPTDLRGCNFLIEED